jgi:asparagine synthase (glutamine-hydrolysing)
MPGLAGFIKPLSDRIHGTAVLESMLQSITYSNLYLTEKHTDNRFIFCGRSEHRSIADYSGTKITDDVSVWTVGELYNLTDLNISHDLSCSEILFNYYKDNSLDTFLESVDGSFAAIVYDKSNQTVHLITDRFGSRRLFWSNFDTKFVWASEIKALLLDTEFNLRIEPVAVDDFLYVGYMLGDRNLIKGIKMVPAATILT